MANPTPFWLETLQGASGPLRVEFIREKDRFFHTLGLVQQGQMLHYLRSVEGAAGEGDDVWPLSPPVQEIHVQGEAPGERTLFLTGATQGGHWSAVVSTPGAADQPTLLFDVAARVRRPPAWLGTSYQCAAGATWTGASQVVRGTDTLCVVLQTSSAEPSELPLVPVVGIAGETSIRSFRAPHLLEQFPATLRWQYAVSLSS